MSGDCGDAHHSTWPTHAPQTACWLVFVIETGRLPNGRNSVVWRPVRRRERYAFCSPARAPVGTDPHVLPPSSSEMALTYFTDGRWRKFKVKVKWSRYRPSVAQRVGRGIVLVFHDRGTRRGWVVSSTPRPHFTLGKDPVPILQEAGWAPGPLRTGGKSRPQRDSIPDLSARSKLLYRLSYRPTLYLLSYRPTDENVPFFFNSSFDWHNVHINL